MNKVSVEDIVAYHNGLDESSIKHQAQAEGVSKTPAEELIEDLTYGDLRGTRKDGTKFEAIIIDGRIARVWVMV